MKKDNLIDSIGKIDDELIESVEKLRSKKKKSTWMKLGSIAACFCLILVGATVWRQAKQDNPPSSGIIVDERGVTLPKMNVSLSANENADMLAFFIYQGNCYVHNEWLSGAESIVGEYLGTATGLINEWTPRDGYVELAGSVKGDFYSVKGYDPSLFLCKPHESGKIATYICNTGITLKYGSELYKDKLHLMENYCGVSYETRDSWNYNKEEVYQLSDARTAEVINFIEGLYSAEFIPWNTAVEQEGHTHGSMVDETENYHVYFEMSDGTTVHLRLYENGYVRWQGILDICVQVLGDSFDTLVNLMESHEGAVKVVN